jgi:hypothetical protein
VIKIMGFIKIPRLKNILDVIKDVSSVLIQLIYVINAKMIPLKFKENFVLITAHSGIILILLLDCVRVIHHNYTKVFCIHQTHSVNIINTTILKQRLVKVVQ